MKLLKQIKGLFPEKFPVGMTAHKAWADDVIKTYGLPDNDSIRFTLAVNIMNTDQEICRRSKRYFANKVKKGMANEVAHAVVMEMKEKQKKEAEAAKTTESNEPSLQDKTV